jgi:hypothetical protein
MKREVTANAGNRAQRCTAPFLQVLVLLLGFLSGCATAPREAKEVYRGYSGTDVRETSLATVELVEVDWAKFNDLHVDGQKYSAVKLLPGPYRIEYSRTFGTSFLVNPNMSVSRAVHATIKLEANRTYRLRADRTYGQGFRIYFWIEDAEGNTVYGTKKDFTSSPVLPGYEHQIAAYVVPATHQNHTCSQLNEEAHRMAASIAELRSSSAVGETNRLAEELLTVKRVSIKKNCEWSRGLGWGWGETRGGPQHRCCGLQQRALETVTGIVASHIEGYDGGNFAAVRCGCSSFG